MTILTCADQLVFRRSVISVINTFNRFVKKIKTKLVSKAEGEDNDMKIDEAAHKRDEFLSVMGVATSDKQGRLSKSKFWANDDAIVESKIDTVHAKSTRPDEVEAEDDNKKSEIDDNSERRRYITCADGVGKAMVGVAVPPSVG